MNRNQVHIITGRQELSSQTYAITSSCGTVSTAGTVRAAQRRHDRHVLDIIAAMRVSA